MTLCIFEHVQWRWALNACVTSSRGLLEPAACLRALPAGRGQRDLVVQRGAGERHQGADVADEPREQLALVAAGQQRRPGLRLGLYPIVSFRAKKSY